MRLLGLLVMMTIVGVATPAHGGQQASPSAEQKTAAPAAGTTKLPREPLLVGTINEIMGKYLYPVGDEVFYVTRNVPKTEKEWNAYEARMLMLAEAGNLLMMPGRAKDQDRWMRDARMLIDAGNAAFKAAKARDVAAIEALNDQMYNACVVCHQDYRPNYRTRVPDPEGLAPLQPPPPPQPAR